MIAPKCGRPSRSRADKGASVRAHRKVAIRDGISASIAAPSQSWSTDKVRATDLVGRKALDERLDRGNFEWSADLVPLYYVWQPAPAKSTYGEGFNPLNLKWNFTSSERVAPYLELGSGVLFTSHVVPLNTSHVNFITHATLGFQFFNNDRRAFTTGILYEHISNAGLTVPNPGINTVQFQIGLNWFR